MLAVSMPEPIPNDDKVAIKFSYIEFILFYLHFSISYRF
ncbi:hypothetical protein yberc0001_34390 [Yersinia bercovieri ATCC 43970]|uniref:Uncharacterized protein n=1 Tax=Yersinia bercovieri ATCC 43970 TaxID=349968 RepID=A0ABM9Y3E8_YERBE|nr:hypothetical protein yberc0001_34390 [Yersinia bercovieri ATCC 43970]